MAGTGGQTREIHSIVKGDDDRNGFGSSGVGKNRLQSGLYGGCMCRWSRATYEDQTD